MDHRLKIRQNQFRLSLHVILRMEMSDRIFALISKAGQIRLELRKLLRVFIFISEIIFLPQKILELYGAYIQTVSNIL